MYKHLFSTQKKEKKGDTACLVASDGTVSNGDLHDHLLSAVDDDEQARSASQFLSDEDSDAVKSLFS